MKSARSAERLNAPIVLLMAIALVAGCANCKHMERRSVEFNRLDDVKSSSGMPARAVGSGTQAMATTPRKVPGQELADMMFDFARAGKAEPLGEYFAAGYTADFANERGDTLLILAAYHRQAEAVRLILNQSDVVVNRQNRMGFTALTGASYQGDVTIMRQLIDAGADANASGPGGKTPLMFAALANREAAVELLLASGADPLAKSADGSTASSLAAGQGSTALAARLAQARR